MRKTLSGVLAAAMLLTSLLASFGDETKPGDTSTTDNSPETTAAEEKLELPDKNWGEREFRVLGYAAPTYTQFSNFEIYSDRENGEVVNDAIFRRNRTIEDKYNVKIVQTLDSSEANGRQATTPVVRKLVMAQEDAYDLVFLPVDSCGSIVRERMLYDLNSVEYINMEKPWWNQTVRKDLEIDGKLFLAASDFSLRDKNRAYIMTVNLDMLSDFKLQHPVELVRKGTWTMDEFNKYVTTVAGDLNGNNETDPEDRFGLGVDGPNGFVALVYGGDVSFLNNENGKLTLTANTEHTINVIEKVMQFYSQKNVSYSPADWGLSDAENNAISSEIAFSGRVLFRTTFPHALQSYSAKSVSDYAIIPFPKYDEKQDGYYSYADPYGMLFGVPVTTPEPEFAGFMLEALSHEATETSLKAYYEISCKTKYTYDPDSAEMLDLIFDGIRYEPALVYNISGQGIIKNIGITRVNDFVTAYASNEEVIRADLEKLIEDIGGAE